MVIQCRLPSAFLDILPLEIRPLYIGLIYSLTRDKVGVCGQELEHTVHLENITRNHHHKHQLMRMEAGHLQPQPPSPTLALLIR